MHAVESWWQCPGEGATKKGYTSEDYGMLESFSTCMSALAKTSISFCKETLGQHRVTKARYLLSDGSSLPSLRHACIEGKLESAHPFVVHLTSNASHIIREDALHKTNPSPLSHTAPVDRLSL